MKKETNLDLVDNWELLNPEILIDLNNQVLAFFKKHPNIEYDEISEHGHSIDLCSMTKEQIEEMSAIFNLHKEKWNLK